MINIGLYNQISIRLSRDITFSYSSSFSSATKLLSPKVADSIVSIYGFVRIADEVVDTWRPKEMAEYLDELTADTKRALKTGFSINPIVHSFCLVVREYGIPMDLIDSFMDSMRMDIKKKRYSLEEYSDYIYGSAEAGGLMCLMVFVAGDKKKFRELKPSARALGSAFQKINFLRDISDDSGNLGRLYFPGKSSKNLTQQDITDITEDINKDLKIASGAIKSLPKSSRYGVELAYSYFSELTKLINSRPASELSKSRASLPLFVKIRILLFIKIKRSFAL